jgi:hypothetical protein
MGSAPRCTIETLIGLPADAAQRRHVVLSTDGM